MNLNIFRNQQSKNAMRKVINQAIGEQIPKLEKNLIAMFLYAVHNRWHYSAKTLEEFAKELVPMFTELEHYYECEGDDEKLCAYVYELEKIGLTQDRIENCLNLKGEIK